MGISWSEDNHFEEFQRIKIGNDVWIGAKVIVLGGVKIGNGAVIGAGAIVTKDIPDYAIAVGIPARVIKYRFERSVIDKLLELNWWNLSDKTLKENITFFQKDNITLTDINNLFSPK